MAADPIAAFYRAAATARIDRLQRKIASAHRETLADLLDLGVRTLARQGGIGHLSAMPVRKRLDQLHRAIVWLNRHTMASMVATGSWIAWDVVKAAIKGRQARWRQHEAANAILYPDDYDDDNPWNPSALIKLSLAKAKSIDVPDLQITPGNFDEWILPPLSHEETLALLQSRNGEGLTWEEQLARSSRRVADPQAMADALSQGISSGEGFSQLRERIKPLIENLNVSAQCVARTESFRVLNTTQAAEYERADKVLSPAGLGIKGMTLHCACMPTSAKDHIARNGKYYAKVSPGRYVADDGEVCPTPPYGHPNCSCYITPKF